MKISVTKEVWNDHLELRLGMVNSDGSFAIARPAVYEVLPRGSLSEPCVCFSPEDAQSLMDLLWNCGIRPTEGAGSAGSMRAVQEHLKDLQAITMALLHAEGIDVK